MYASLHEAYGWTRDEADAHLVGWILDIMIVKSKTNKDKEDEILPFDKVF